jgi:hypothetical protein
MTIQLSTLALILGLGVALPQVFGLMNPQGWTAAWRKFPRSLPWGFALMILGTAWFVFNLQQETIADLAASKNLLYLLFAAVGIGSCIFVQDFLAVRGLAVVFLLLAKLMVDTGRPHLAQTPWVVLFQAWAYALVIAGMWLTISPWRMRNLIEWSTANEKRIKVGCGIRLGFGLLIAALGMTVF